MTTLRQLLRLGLLAGVAVSAAVTLVRLLGLDAGIVLVPLVAAFPWFVVLAVVTALVGLLVREVPLAAAAAVVAVVGATVLAPRVLPGPTPAVPPDGPRLVVGVANLKIGRADPTVLVDRVRDEALDVLVLVELTPEAAEGLTAAGLDELLPSAALQPLVGPAGTGIRARVPVELIEHGTAPRVRWRPAVAVDVPDGPPLTVVAAHPPAPVGPARLAGWYERYALLPPAPAADEPVGLLLGDLNATLDHSVLRDLLATGWVDAADAVGAGLWPTYSGLRFGRPVPPIAIDHVLVDPRVGVEAVRVHDLPGSDHRLVVADLRLPSGIG